MIDCSSCTPPCNVAAPNEGQAQFIPFLIGADLPEELINRLCKVLCPPARATIDMPAFVRLIGISHSLSALDKFRVFNELPTLSQDQIDELSLVMNDEVDEFAKLVPTEWRPIASLSARSWLHLCLVADHLGAGYVDEATERQALVRMLERKFRGAGRHRWVRNALGWSILGDHVFSAYPNAVRRLPIQSQLPEVF